MIRTRRLLLRRARPADLAPIHAILSDPEAMAFWSTAPHADIDQSRSWLVSMIEANEDQSDDFIVEHQGRVIGKAGCWRLPEIGFIFRADHWGQGFAREALEAVIAHLFACRDIAAITADVDPRNIRSLRLLERLGFEETGRARGTYEISGKLCDSIYLALRRPALSDR